MRRNELDITADIVNVTRQGLNKTGLVYQANLNFNIVKKYIKKMTDSGLLEKKNGRYFSTPKGDAFLASYRSTMVFFSEAPTMEVI